jgi:high-affinity K+ transport system ATPase subunit B
MTKIEKIIIIIAVGLFVTMLFNAFAEDLPNSYQPTEIQTLHLQVKQRDAQLAQKDFFIAQQNLQIALKALNDEAAKVKVENNWPDGLVFNQEKLSFTENRSKQ